VETVKDLGKRNVVGVLVDALDYDAATERVIDAAKMQVGFAVTALAVHGVMTGVGDKEHRHRLNHFDIVTPDGQPVRWALNLLHRTNLKDRVYGPNLSLRIYAEAAREGLPVYFYGSRQEVLDALQKRLPERFPGFAIAGAEPSKFRRTSPEEKDEIVQRIKDSGAKIVMVGLGCPRQEVFTHEYHEALGMPVIAVGAAFDYHAGMVDEPPEWIQRSGLQWLYRLLQQPTRLWKRYLLLNPAYMTLVALQALHVWRPNPSPGEAPKYELLYG
jgi:N-acetylglucosaminyldiphosphoundecaprenol N-acetyl-beta-D-mannosaminyltransferase